MKWEEELTQIIYNQTMKPQYRVLFQHRIEGLILKIRKQDEENLIKNITHAGGSEECYANNFKQLIKDYYNQ